MKYFCLTRIGTLCNNFTDCYTSSPKYTPDLEDECQAKCGHDQEVFCQGPDSTTSETSVLSESLIYVYEGCQITVSI